VKVQIESPRSKHGTSVLGGAIAHGSGVFQSTALYNVSVDESQVEPATGVDSGAATHTFTRRVGLQYVMQVLLNSLPLLLVDILTLASTMIACRLIWHYFALPVRFDFSAFLIPITTGFFLLNIELGLYPGVRLSPVEELRRLVV
jgi:hypothetical protein